MPEKTTKTRRTYKPKAPLNEYQAKVKRIAKKKEEKEQQLEAQNMVAELYEKNFPTFIEDRQKEFEQALILYEEENADRISMQDNKLSQDDLEYLISKPLTIIHGTEKKYSAVDLMTASQCYWDCVRKANKVMGNTPYIPTIEQFCGMLGVASSYMSKLYNSSDANIANVAEMIKDKFISYYTVNGMTNRINTIMAIFTLKARHNMRDNEAPQIVVNNMSTTMSKDEIANLEKQYFINGSSDIIDV